MTNVKNKSTISKAIDVFLIVVWMTAIPAAGVFFGAVTDRAAAILNLPAWVWQVYWACAVVCIAAGIYTRKWVHCWGLAMIFFAMGSLGVSSVIGESNGSFELSELAYVIGPMLGLMVGVGGPVLSALMGLLLVQQKRVLSRPQMA